MLTRRRPRFVGLIDDDVVLSVADLNRLLHLAGCHDLHAFSASLSHDSEYTHPWSLTQPHRVLREVDWVEVMMPFYRGELFLAGAPHYDGNVSSWGIDRYLIPTLQQLPHFGRMYAAYGGAFIALSMAWGGVDGVRPDRWDLVGSAVYVTGVGLILYGPRG